MPSLLRTLRDSIRTKLWPVPVVAVVAAFAAGVLVPRLDAQVDGSVPSWLAGLLFGGDAEAGRTVLDAVSSSLITVTSLTFSLTVVTLQLASSQFSPRLLRTFTSDVFVQATLGLFLATFTYSLTVLRAVRSGDDDGAAFVPQVSITLSFVLAVASVVGLVVFLAHLARQIRVETMLRDVHQDASATVAAVLDRAGDATPGSIPAIPEDAVRLFAGASGFVVDIDHQRVVDAARAAEAVVVITAQPGNSIIEGTPIGRAWSLSGVLTGPTWAELQTRVSAAVRAGYERTAAQDIGYGLRQLTDVTNKALSPGINDPTTAIHALGHISALLCELADRDLSPGVLRDEDGIPRGYLCRSGLAHLVDQAINQPRRYGAADPQVMTRLFGLLTELAWRLPPSRHHIVADQLERLRATAASQDFDAVETKNLLIAARSVEEAMTARVTAFRPV